jgi:hypothetical protein
VTASRRIGDVSWSWCFLTRRSSIALWIACIIAPASHAQTRSATTLKVVGDSVCAPYSLHLRRIGSLSNSTGQPIKLGMPRSAIRLPNGRIVVSYYSPQFVPIEFDSVGTMRHPGLPTDASFSGLTYVLQGAGDSLEVHDEGTGRVTVLDSAYRAGRSFALDIPMLHDVVRTPSGAFAAAALIPTAEEAGYPLHTYTASGVQTRSFGTDFALLDPRSSGALRRELSASTGSRFWAAHALEYEIELFDTTGTRRLLLVRDSSDSPLRHSPVDRVVDFAPRPTVTAIREDVEGRLWVILHVAAPDWYEAGHYARRVVDDTVLVIPKFVDRLYQTVIEVIDPRDGKLIASRQFPLALVSFLDGHLALGLRQHRDGKWETDLLQLSLQAKSERLNIPTGRRDGTCKRRIAGQTL